MKTLQKIALHKTTAMTASQMKRITGGSNDNYYECTITWIGGSTSRAGCYGKTIDDCVPADNISDYIERVDC